MTTREESAAVDFAAADEVLRLYEQMEIIRRTEKEIGRASCRERV